MRLVLCFILLDVRSGQANETPKELSVLFSQGKSLLNKGNYSAAAHAFREAVEIAQRLRSRIPRGAQKEQDATTE